MSGIIYFILIALTVGLVILMLYQGLRGTVDLLSARNFFLTGLIVFQITSAAVTIRSGRFVDVSIANLPAVAREYTILLLLFLALFFWAYSKGWVVTGLARRVPVGDALPGVSSALTLAIAFLAVGMLLRLVLIYIPVVGVLTGIVGPSILAVAAGMAVWAYTPRLLNPIVGAVTLAIIVAAAAVTIHKTFGRRDLLCVVLCCIWGAYHSYWKHLSPLCAAGRLAVISIAGLVLLAAFSAVRSGGERDRSAGQIAQLMTRGNVKDGVLDVLSGQLAGQNSMWIIENYPERFKFQPLGSLVYFIVNPVPRSMWPGKPSGLGLIMVDQSGAGIGKTDDFTLGPGLIGHIVADNPWLSLVTYAFGLGLFLRFLDDLVRIHWRNPFVVLPIGVALGQIVGMPRGELGLFMFQTVSGMIFAFVGMLMVARLMSLFGWKIKAEASEVGNPEEQDSDDGSATAEYSEGDYAATHSGDSSGATGRFMT